MPTVGFLFLLLIITFALGSIPWGVIISRVFYHTDLRQHGSGNIGTTNAIRTMGKVGGYAVFLLDFGKGIVSGIIATVFAVSIIPGDVNSLVSFAQGLGYQDSPYVFIQQVCLACAFFGCVMGHIFSPWLGFHGGKGIAVAVGCLFSTFGIVGACLELLIFIVLVVATKYVSVGSIAAALACPFFALFFFWGNPLAWLLCTLAALTVVWAHRENIARLRAGNESRIGQKKEAKQG